MLLRITWSPSRRQLRNFGLVGAFGFAAVGAMIYAQHRFLGASISVATATTAAYYMWAAAGLALVGALLWPRAMRPLYFALTVLTLPIALVVSLLVLLVIYYVIVTPVGLVMRLVGWDPMHRAFDRDAASYWVRRVEDKDIKRYYRQY